MTRPRQTITHLKAEVLTQHPDNIRDDLGDLTDLALSIREHGVLQPITVTEHHLGGYLILAGHRRFNAGRDAGLTSFPAIIRHDLNDHAEQIVVMLVENMHRRDLSPVEKAEALSTLRHQGLTLGEIARRTGVHPTTISSLLNLMDLDETSREEVRQGRLNAGDAIAAVREVRQQARLSSGSRRRGRPVVVEPPHLNFTHPLYRHVAASCAHTTRPSVGAGKQSGCGQCWEAVIRADALGLPMPHAEIDEVVVQRVLDGIQTYAALPERVEVVRRWRASGRSLAELARQTMWKIERYYDVGSREDVAS